MDNLGDSLHFLTRQINAIFANREPWQIATITATTVLSTVWLWEFFNQDESKSNDCHCVFVLCIHVIYLTFCFWTHFQV